MGSGDRPLQITALFLALTLELPMRLLNCHERLLLLCDPVRARFRSRVPRSSERAEPSSRPPPRGRSRQQRRGQGEFKEVCRGVGKPDLGKRGDE